jgi:predicted MPP superfamily phosphohydrolase
VGLRQPYTAGLHRLGRPVKHMGRATGDWGPPKRIGALSEITHLRLIAVPAIG